MSALHQFAILVTVSLLLVVLVLELFQQQQTAGTYNIKDGGQDGQDGEKQVVVVSAGESESSSLSTISRLLETNEQVKNDDLFEGDIMPTWESISAIYGEETAIKLGLTPPVQEDINIQHGSGDKSSITFWNNAWNKKHEKYVIWIYIHSGHYSSSQRDKIKLALKQLANRAGTFIFRFPTTRPGNNKPYLSIESLSGCWSYVGRTSYSTQSGGQKISLSGGCLSTGTIQHEMMVSNHTHTLVIDFICVERIFV